MGISLGRYLRRVVIDALGYAVSLLQERVVIWIGEM